MHAGKDNTSKAKGEMKKALSKEATLRERFQQGGDCSLMCLGVWFALVVLMLIVDL